MTLLGTFAGAGDDSSVPESRGVQVRVNGGTSLVLAASPEEISFLCPNLSAGTPLSVAVEAAGQVSDDYQTVMQGAAPGLFSVNGSGTGQGFVTHAHGIAALPRFDLDGTPAAPGDTVKLFATGMNCENSNERLPLLHFGHSYQTVTLVAPSALAGLCEVYAVVPEGVSGSKVEMFLEAVRDDATVVRSNTILIAVDEPIAGH